MSWYRAFTVGGGESSNQYKSQEIFLACLARTWATLFPSLLIHLIDTYRKPISRHLTSFIILPSKDWLVGDEQTALITVALSPSMMSFENPASMENSIVFLHAKASASSLFDTSGPISDIAAIISPYSFWIIAQNPEQFWSAKMATLKFILKTKWGGGCHFFLADASVGVDSCSC